MRAKEFILENRGLPFPGTYEEEYGMFKRKGPRRIIAMTNEALESSYPYKQESPKDYSFTTDSGIKYRVFFTGIDYVEIVFTSDDGAGNEKASLTGTGDSLKVFGTVVKIIKDFIELKKPKTLYFTAESDEPSRVKLYKTLLSRVDKELPNYVSLGTTDYRKGTKYAIGRKEETVPDAPSNDTVSHFKFKDKQEVNEIADNPYPYRPNIKTKDKRIYRFETDDGLLYRVQVFNIHDAGNPNALEIHFDQTDKETGKQNSGITGTGDSLRVFATVAHILQKEVAQQNPTGLIITSKANDTSRVKLYRTLARRATKVMPQFEITGERMVKDHEGEPYLTIILKTKDQ